ncbi:MAG: TIGR01212 family radical SAM protein [Thermodesulfobacteriota bacterium]
MTDELYRGFSGYLSQTFGCRVHKITVDAGLGCPNRDGTIARGGCLYCNARGSGTGAAREGLSVSRQIERSRLFLSRRYGARKFLAYFQSFTNTHAPVALLRSLWEEALSCEGVAGLSVGTRPDCVPEPVLALMEELARKTHFWAEYGLQSACNETLARINRGHDAACFADAVARTRGRGIRICGHVILGLPGETREHMMKTADFIAGLGLDGVKLHLLYVVKGTGMEALYRQGEYRPLDREEYVSLVADFLERLPPATVIQRLTGDPHPEELVAPSWALGGKARTLALIREELSRRGSFQGRHFRG